MQIQNYSACSVRFVWNSTNTRGLGVRVFLFPELRFHPPMAQRYDRAMIGLFVVGLTAGPLCRIGFKAHRASGNGRFGPIDLYAHRCQDDSKKPSLFTSACAQLAEDNHAGHTVRPDLQPWVLFFLSFRFFSFFPTNSRRHQPLIFTLLSPPSGASLHKIKQDLEDHTQEVNRPSTDNGAPTERSPRRAPCH
jgi:hypothetical protein